LDENDGLFLTMPLLLDECAAPTDGQVAHSVTTCFIGQGLGLSYEAFIWMVSQGMDAQMLSCVFRGGFLYFEAEPYSEMVP
jgi:hypothetical protein